MNNYPSKMLKLNFEYDSHSNESVATVGNWRVKVWQDECAPNPFEFGDCGPPLMVKHGRDSISIYEKGFDLSQGRNRGKGFKTDLERPFTLMSGGFIRKHQRQICDILSLDYDKFHKEALDLKPDYSCGLIDIKTDLFQEVLSEILNHDYFRALESLWTLMGVPCLYTTISGYSQGDSGIAFICAHDEYLEHIGGSRKHWQDSDYLRSQVKTYASWAYGDVYGFTIENDKGESLDSCGGFYGSDHESNGLEAEALNALNYAISQAKAESVSLRDKIKALLSEIKGLRKLTLNSPLTCEALSQSLKTMVSEYRYQMALAYGASC